MGLKRTCYLCGKPVDIRRRMSLFCSPRCEAVYAQLHGEAARSPARTPGALPGPVPATLAVRAPPPLPGPLHPPPPRR